MNQFDTWLMFCKKANKAVPVSVPYGTTAQAICSFCGKGIYNGKHKEEYIIKTTKTKRIKWED